MHVRVFVTKIKQKKLNHLIYLPVYEIFGYKFLRNRISVRQRRQLNVDLIFE